MQKPGVDFRAAIAAAFPANLFFFRKFPNNDSRFDVADTVDNRTIRHTELSADA